MDIQFNVHLDGQQISQIVTNAGDIRQKWREQEEHQRLRIQMAYDSVEQAAKENHNGKEEGQGETEEQWDETFSNPRVIQHLQQMADEALDEIAQLSQDCGLYEKERA